MFLKERMDAFLKQVVNGEIQLTEEDVARERENQAQMLNMVPQNLQSEVAENWVYLTGGYVKDGRLVDVVDELKAAYAAVTLDKVTEVA